jgi:hypothetical protein
LADIKENIDYAAKEKPQIPLKNNEFEAFNYTKSLSIDNTGANIQPLQPISC